MHYKKLVTHVEPQASAVSLLKRAENSAIEVIINRSKCELFHQGNLFPAPCQLFVLLAQYCYYRLG